MECLVDRFVEANNEIYTLQVGTTRAQIVPSIGANCSHFSIQKNGEWIDVIDPPPSLLKLQERPSGFGNPILFPFPNRIRSGRFNFEGETYIFDKPANSPNSIHGLLLDHSFVVTEFGSSSDNLQPFAYITCQVESEKSDWIMRQYPFPFLFEITYTLTVHCLRMDILVQNMGQKRLPMGLGMHPYFRVLFSPDSQPQNSWVTIPANQYWELNEFLPTGRILETQDPELINGKCFSDLKLDDIFTNLICIENGSSICSINDRSAGISLQVEADSNFRQWVVYTPPDRHVICFEPYTCPTDAVNLVAKNTAANLIILEPKGSEASIFSASIEFRVE